MKGKFSDGELAAMSPQEFRSIVRRGEYTDRTTNVCRGYTQANLVVIPQEMAFEFLLFCLRNPQPCPLLDVTEFGDPCPKLMAPEADLRTDLPGYRIYKEGKLIDEPTDVISYWRDDLVGFLLGCSHTLSQPLQNANVKFRDIGVYTSNIRCTPAGRFHGYVAITCFLVKGAHDAVRTIQITSRYLIAHGPPMHIGEPTLIGIEDLYHPDVYSLGDIAPQEPDEIAMFLGCGITPQLAAIESKISFMITHLPGCMFITDKLTEELAIL